MMKLRFLALASAALLSACATPDMALPPSLAAADGERITFETEPGHYPI